MWKFIFYFFCMNKFKSYVKGFTLVELIIVITILAILATIAFISFQNYNKDARNGNRLANINNIEKWLNLYQLKTGSFPLPEKYITLFSNSAIIGYQWIFWDNNSRLINFNKTPIDPLDSWNYTYSTNLNQNMYQWVWFLENSSNLTFENNLITNTYASSIDYSKRILKTFWKELGILLINTWSNINKPLNELYNEVSFTGINISSFTWTLSNGVNIWELKVAFNDTPSDNIVGTWAVLSWLKIRYGWYIEMVMTSCPAGWSVSTINSIPWNGGESAYCWANSCKICSANNDMYTIPSWTEIVMPSCPAGWSVSTTNSIPWSGGGSVLCLNTTDWSSSCKICSANDDMYVIPSWTEIVMPSCPAGWSVSTTNSITTTSTPWRAYCWNATDWFTSCKICKKN